MAELKTKPTDVNVDEFLAGLTPERRRLDSIALNKMMKRITGFSAKMWGPSIVGFGSYHYKYESGREGDYLLTGFSPRKKNMVVYIMPGFGGHGHLMSKLGKYKTGKSCLYINKLDDVDVAALEELIRSAFEVMTEKYGG